MATSPTAGLIHQLRSTVLLRDGAGLTDGQLLEAYTSRRDEAALSALVKRHGSMVWCVCRRILGNHHDAEDAFQATFLVLVRKAPSIRPSGMVANWLYGVARQTALKARATVRTRNRRERQVAEMPEPAAAAPAGWDELLPLLDEELSRLPDRYRAVVVLCDLEGRTRKEAARQLGVPEGTVAGWIARARVMLAGRLTRRGLALPGGALAVILSQNVASAGIPASVVSKTIKVASLLATGQATAGEISVTVAALTEGVLRTMFLSKLKVAVGAMMLVVVLIGSGAAIGLGQPSNSPTPKAADPEATQAKAAAGKRETPTPQPALTSGPDLEVGKAYVFSLPIGALKELDGKVVEIRGHWVKVESREEALQYWVNLGTVSVIMPLPGRD